MSMEGMELFYEFIQDVRDHPENHNQLVHLAVDRHLNDIKKSKKNTKSFPYVFNEFAAVRAIRFVKLLRHTQGEFAGKLFDLQPYQAFILGSIFGWQRRGSNYRRYTKAYCELPRKNGKSEFASAINAYGFLADREIGAEIYSAATKKDQAMYVHNACESMMRQLKKDSPAVDEWVKIYKSAIVCSPTSSFIKPLAADSKKEDGANPHFAVIDEYHAHPNDGLYKVIETGMGARRQPLLFIITTAGFNKYSPCYEFRGVCISYLKGILKNENTFCIIFALDEGDDWKDKTKWIKANPNLGNAPYLRYMETQLENATTEGSTAEVEFRTKNLNEWMSTGKKWVKSENLIQCRLLKPKKKDFKEAKNFAPKIKDGGMVVLGLDLSTTEDITALSIKHLTRSEYENHYFIPQQKVEDRKNKDGINYHSLARRGFVNVTEGNVIDYDAVKVKIQEIQNRFEIMAIGYDPYNSSQLIIELTDMGFECIKVLQGYPQISPPAKALHRTILSDEMKYVYNPITEWMFDNVEIKTDPNGNIKPDKSDAKKRIDGVVAMIMAHGISMMEDYAYLTDGEGEDSEMVFDINS